MVIAEACVVEESLIDVLQLALALVVWRPVLGRDLEDSLVGNELCVLIDSILHKRLFAIEGSSDLDFAIWTHFLIGDASGLWALSQLSQRDVCIQRFAIAVFVLCSVVAGAMCFIALQSVRHASRLSLGLGEP